MIEFTQSRVVLCLCGVALLAAVMGALSPMMDDARDDIGKNLADSVATMLDGFHTSSATMMLLDGDDVLPNMGCRLDVSGNVVSVICGDETYRAPTIYTGTFSLPYGGSVLLDKSVSEGLGDVADGVCKDVHLFEAIVQIH